MSQDIEEQFLEAYEHYADALFRHCFFRVYDRELAKDLTQETFCRTWTYLADGKEIKKIRAFLYRVLHHVIVDEIRRKKPISLDQLVEKGFSPPDESASNMDRRLEIQHALQKLVLLEQPERDVLEMRFIDDLSPGEIASVLGVSENVISVRIHRGVKKLRQLIHGGQP